MTVANATSILGARNDATDSTAMFTPGTVMLANGTDYVYALAASAIAAAGTTNLTGAFGATTTTAGSNYTHDVASPGVASGAYFWARKVTGPF